ncbi:hypothetical protein BGZ61DRAFT_470351 [Ilyonectria robusta]|uniref:uncharacterized protein n=1 Tax=Ilyonectria robusta TaxID=1079257 RepID=UPI001E8CB635|nr:uncharacterized protein BGZ61DRAFT_470351 [Ilyonectria robusta]KAH8736839.1 hypothetical protein BGZ61DRAFT_470351 [Ilyonectria robusta]
MLLLLRTHAPFTRPLVGSCQGLPLFGPVPTLVLSCVFGHHPHPNPHPPGRSLSQSLSRAGPALLATTCYDVGFRWAWWAWWACWALPGLAPSWPTIRRHPSPSIRAAAIKTPVQPIPIASHPPQSQSLHPSSSSPALFVPLSSTPPRLHALPPSSIRRRGALKPQPQPSSSRPLPPTAATAAGALDPVFPIHPIHPSHLRLSIPSSPSSSTSPPLTLSLSRRVASLHRVDNRTRANFLLGLRLSSLGRQHRGAAQRTLGSIFCGDPRTRCAQLAPSSSSSLPSSSRNQSVAPSRAAVALVYL